MCHANLDMKFSLIKVGCYQLSIDVMTYHQMEVVHRAQW